MKTKFLVRAVQLLPVFLFWSTLMFAQQLKLGDNPSAQQKSALLELESKSQGLLLPRISDTTSGVITTAPDGMIIYLTLNNSLCIRSNGHWRPLLPQGYAITSMNGQTIAVQSLATTNTAGALGFTSAAGTHTLNIPDATATNSGFVNTNAQTLAGAKTFTNTLTANQDVYLTGINIDNTKDSVLLIDGGKLLKKQLTGLPPTGTAGGDLSGTYPNPAIAAGAVTGTKIAQAGATTGQVLKWNGTTWAPAADDNSGSISSIGLVVPSFLTVSPATLTANGTFTIGASNQSPNLVFAGPSTGSTAAAPTFRSLVAPDMTISSTQRLIGRYSNGSGVAQEVSMDKTLKMLTSGYLYVDTTLAVYNAQKIQSVKVATTAPTTGQVLKYDGTNWTPAADDNAGLTSVGLSLPLYSFANSPLTANGTLTGSLSAQTANTILAAPNGSNGAPSFRTLVAADIPTLAFSKISGTVPVSQGGTGLTAIGTAGQVLTSNGTSLTWATPGASTSGLTSVGLTMPSIFTVANSPLTANGTLGVSFNNQTANTVLAGPTSGAAASPTFRALGSSDIQGVNSQKLLGRYATTSGAAQEVTLDNTLKLNTAGTLYADSALAVWNAGKVQGVKVSAATPTSGQVLKYNSTTGIWEPNTDNDGGATYGKATTQDISYATADGSTTVMKIWQSNVKGTVVNGPAYTNAYAWSTMAFNGTDYTTQLYFDKNTLAIKEWNGVTAPLTTNPGNGWYKAILTNGDNKIGVNAIVYGKRTYDASAEAASDSANFVYVEGTKRLGIGTNNPQYNLDVNGTERVTGATTLGSTLAVSGATTLGSTLGVSGATTLGSTLGVSGATTLSSTLGVSGATTLNSTATINGAATLNSTLFVDGNTTLDGTLKVGSAGSNLTNIIKTTVNVPANTTVNANSSGTISSVTINNVTGLTNTSSITVNPPGALTAGVSIGYCYSNGANLVIVFSNTTNGSKNISNGNGNLAFIVTIIN